jgi:hypothetical protein
MNKRALIGFVISSVIIVIILAAIFFYFQFRNNGLQITSGNIQIDINYNETSESPESPENNNSIDVVNATDKEPSVVTPFTGRSTYNEEE